MNPCTGGLQLYACIPDSAPDVQALILGAFIGVPFGAVFTLLAFLFWGRWWLRLFNRVFQPDSKG